MYLSEFSGSENSSTVSLISGGTAPNVTGTATVGRGPAAIAYDPVNNLMYVVNWADYTLSLISGSQTTNTFQLGCNPYVIAYDPADQEMYQSCVQSAYSSTMGDEGFLRVISGTTISPSNITLGPEGTYNLVYDPSNQEMFAASVDAGGIMAIDGTNVVGNLTLAGNIAAQSDSAVYNPSNQDIYVTEDNSNDQPGRVLVVSSTDKLVGNISVGAWPSGLAYDPVNHAVYVSNGEDEIHPGSINAICGTSLVENLTVGVDPTNLLYNPVSKYLYVSNSQSDTVSVISPSITCPSSTTAGSSSSPSSSAPSLSSTSGSSASAATTITTSTTTASLSSETTTSVASLPSSSSSGAPTTTTLASSTSFSSSSSSSASSSSIIIRRCATPILPCNGLHRRCHGFLAPGPWEARQKKRRS